MWEQVMFNPMPVMFGDSPAKILKQRIIPIFIIIVSKCGVFSDENGD